MTPEKPKFIPTERKYLASSVVYCISLTCPDLTHRFGGLLRVLALSGKRSGCQSRSARSKPLTLRPASGLRSVRPYSQQNLLVGLPADRGHFERNGGLPSRTNFIRLLYKASLKM